MILTAEVLLASAVTFCAYPYVVYPVVLGLVGRRRRRALPAGSPVHWPAISVALPVYNEAAVIAETLESILALDYPPDRRQVLVVSDASTDRTDEIVSRFADRGVELLRLPQRIGKTAAENAARAELRGEIIVNTDASVRIHPQAVKRLVAALADPTVGVASGRDVSVARLHDRANVGESAYTGYEMWVRDLETRVWGIVGASGCLYAIRADLQREYLAEDLSRDFAAALIARRRGLRAVSVSDAVCFVPRSASLRQEYGRKVRTMTRGLQTLWAMRALINPLRYGAFAWMLFSHKLCRWLVPWAGLVSLGALTVVAVSAPWARAILGLVGGACVLAGCGWLWPEGRGAPQFLAVPAFAAAGTVAALHAWIRMLAGIRTPVWEPTRRPPLPGAVAADHHR
jgi:glycosyltransferase involved in cell wall biosynthesis